MDYTKQELEEMMKENGGWLDLSGTQITSLPEGLTVGGSLYLSGTLITSLPEGLTVGGSLDLSGTLINDRDKELKKVRSLQDGDHTDKYIYCDNILTHIKSKKKIGKYTFYIGKIKNRNVVTDGELYAHCASFKEGVLDIEFKKSKDRGSEQYANLKLDSTLTYDEAVVCYRIITGACRQGTQQFLDSLREKKKSYTIAEIIEKTKGQFGNTTFADFFKRNA